MEVSEILRVYLDPADIGDDGYPYRWHRPYSDEEEVVPAIKHLVRELAGHRCVRCKHPFVVGETKGEWSPCDHECTHGLPLRLSCAGYLDFTEETMYSRTAGELVREHDAGPCAWRDGFSPIQAQWRVLTVHHLNGVKHDCRWWNLVPLCQRDHLYIQSKVRMERPWHDEHSEWFKIYAAGYYAWAHLGEELPREETAARLDELLALEQTHATQRLW